ATGFGVNLDAGIHAAYLSTGVSQIVVQRNTIHDTRYDTNDWSYGHPAGPMGITFENCSETSGQDCGGNYVIRWNDVIGNDQHHWMDGIGGEGNFTDVGNPHNDSDFYGNRVTYAWDDGIELEGADRNVRAWGNYIDHTYTGIATAC